MKNMVVLFFLLCAPCVSRADELTFPVPRKPGARKFYDRVGKIEFASAATLTAFDAAATCHALANGGREVSLPTQHCPQVTLILFGELVVQEVAAYSFHRIRWYKAEKLVRFVSVAANARGIAYSKTHGTL
jgi:hypothetical protein